MHDWFHTTRFWHLVRSIVIFHFLQQILDLGTITPLPHSPAHSPPPTYFLRDNNCRKLNSYSLKQSSILLLQIF